MAFEKVLEGFVANIPSARMCKRYCESIFGNSLSLG